MGKKKEIKKLKKQIRELNEDLIDLTNATTMLASFVSELDNEVEDITEDLNDVEDFLDDNFDYDERENSCEDCKCPKWDCEEDIDLVIDLENSIKDVVFKNRDTFINWTDGKCTKVHCSENDKFDPSVGLVTAIVKRFAGNKDSYNAIVARILNSAKYIGTAEEFAPRKKEESNSDDLSESESSSESE